MGHSSEWRNVSDKIKVAELFAGVGGFRLALDGYHNPARPEFDMPSAGPFETIWANQWEPPGTSGRQFAARCYEQRFGANSVVVEDIAKVLDAAERGEFQMPVTDMVVGGFPCQDYSVARPLSQATGIEGKKGVLWWEIYRFLHLQIERDKNAARYCLFENVDRLLKSPASQRGRDFAIILSCLADLGYSVEWRVVNSAEYGFPQRRKRVYIFAERNAEWNIRTRLLDGVMSRALPMDDPNPDEVNAVVIPKDPYDASEGFNKGGKTSPFKECGVMVGNTVLTGPVKEVYDGPKRTLGSVLVPEETIPAEFFIDQDKLPKWEYLKGAKRERRVNKKTGFEYWYAEGSMAFPDALDKPSRTILTGEGGSGASRFKHVIECPGGRYRRLVPDELDQLQGFPRGWTNTGMTDGNRAFCMGNALVVGVPHRIGKAIAELRGGC